ncbi:unnamed protein product [Vicia faba]|uniref:Uncharacterized protein n=1 Tax=Vicia faba TaxID=3906 RepID=A0AAV1AEY4_VICFA|nr:unnamed protein product [Vicia faba]
METLSPSGEGILILDDEISNPPCKALDLSGGTSINPSNKTFSILGEVILSLAIETSSPSGEVILSLPDETLSPSGEALDLLGDTSINPSNKTLVAFAASDSQSSLFQSHSLSFSQLNCGSLIFNYPFRFF